ncbi:MAG: YceI family protein [Cyclobacteriaceae bacterium]|nr:YceI family protein [Cyclobacteriaceae bacterium]
MKRSLVIVLLLAATSAYSQVFFTRNGKVSFFSKTPMENIDAVNSEVFSAFDSQKGDLAFAILIKSFRFEKALMEEHFNENYMESDKLPKSTFNGKVVNLKEVDVKKDGTYNVQVEGELTIHGVTKKVAYPGQIIVAGGKVSAKANFQIKLADYDVKIPSVVAGKIAETIDITVDCQYQPK